MKYVLFLLSVLFLSSVTAQKRPADIKDDPQSRADFELLRLQDPSTGDIPRGIRRKELNFMSSNLVNQRSGPSSWINRGPYNVGGRTRALAVDINDENIILAGGVSGGIWKTVNQGDTWVKTTASTNLQSTSCIAQDPRGGQTDVWYYGTGEITGNSAGGSGAPYRGDGIFKSTDGGNTWSILESTSTDTPEENDQDFDYNYEIKVNPVNGNVLVANNGGIYQSTDGGTSFEKILDDNSGRWTDVEVDAQGVIYASIAAAGIFRSEDNGATWLDLTEELELSAFDKLGPNRKKIALAPTNPNILYVIGLNNQNASGHMLFKYDHSQDIDEDGIGEWTDLSLNIPQDGGASGDFNSQGGYDLIIKVKPNDENFVIIGGINLYASSNGFSTPAQTEWIGGYTALNDGYSLYSNQHPDHHSFVFLSGNMALSGNDGGVQLTLDITSKDKNENDEPVDWIWKNNGYLTSQVYAISIGPENQIMAGFQDNSTWLGITTDSDEIWTDQFGGDGAYNAFNSDGSMRWMSSQQANIYRVFYSDGSDDITASAFVPFTPSQDYSNSLFITPFYLDPQDDNLFYLGGDNNLFVNTSAMSGNSNIGWEEVFLNSTGVITELGTSLHGIVYVGTSSGEVHRVVDPGGSNSKKNITGDNFPSGYISGISVNDYNPNEVIVCFSNYSIPSVFHTLDGGETWTDISGNLEEFPNGQGSGPSARTVGIIGNGDYYMVGTSAGLYSTSNLEGGSTFWSQQAPDDIGNVVVEHLVRRDGYVVIGTHGNGAFSSDFITSGGLANDLSIIGLEGPFSGPLGNEKVAVRLINLGENSQNSYTVNLIINGDLIASELVEQEIASFDLLSYEFLADFDFSQAGDYEIEIQVTVNGDENNANDVFFTSVTSSEVLGSFPYNESFNSAEQKWTGTGQWELAEPNGTIINSTLDGGSAWILNPNGNYSDNQIALLESPFFDLSALESPVLSFDLIYEIEDEWDGAVLAYRTNLVEEYTTIEEGQFIQGEYSKIATVFGELAWTGSSDGWENSQVDVSFLTSSEPVQFAFIFRSDGAEVEEGIAVDRFKICENCLPTEISISVRDVVENLSIGTLVGTLSTTDLDDDSHDYELLPLSDFNSFSLDEADVLTNEVLDADVKTSYSIRISSTDDDGNQVRDWILIRVVPEVPLGQNDLEKNGISLFPNPAKGRLNMNMFNDYYGPVSVRITSIDGKSQIIDKNVQKTTASLRRLVDLSILSDGLYIIELQMGDQILRGKIIKD